MLYLPKRRRGGKFAFGRRTFLAGSAATLAAAGGVARAQSGAGEVNVWNWSDYIGETTLEDFTAATGIRVNYNLFETNDEVLEAIQAGNPDGYDVIFPSSEYVESMVRANLLQVLDHGAIPNVYNIDPFFMEPGFDIGRAYSLPYFWGTVGLGYRSSVAAVTRWADVFRTDGAPGRVVLMATTDLIQAALKTLGHSANSTNPAEIAAAADLVIAAKSNIVGFVEDNATDLLLAGEADVAMDWNGSVLLAIDEDEDIGFAVPEEGSMLWEDTMCVPVGARNVDNAHAFINFILDAEVHASIADEVFYACPNAAAQAYIDPENLANPAIYPPGDVLARCEPSFWQGEEVEAMYRAAVERVLAA